MSLKDIGMLAAGLAALVFAALYYYANRRLGDLQADKIQREQKQKIDNKKEKADEAKVNFEERLKHFRELLNRYRKSGK